MEKFFHPHSIVVLGVSPNKGNLAAAVLYNLRHNGFTGRIYAVGRSGGTVEGIDVIPRVADLPETPDLAVIYTPAPTVPAFIRECGEKGIRHAVIVSGGFGEMGAERLALDRELREAADRFGLRYIGPNCFGVICPQSGVATCYALLKPGIIRPGSFSFISQSGTFILSAGHHVTRAGVGAGKLISVGNKLNVDEVDLLPYLMHQDSATKTIGLYLEAMNRGREFIELARTSPKPIVVLKGNISEEMSTVARSHTASLASDDRVVEGAFRQAGIIRITELRKFATTAKALTLPLLRGNNLGIAVGGGGSAVTASDFCFREGLCLPPLPVEFAAALRERSRSGIITYGNPIDLADSAGIDAVLFAAERLLALPQVDGLVLSPICNPAVPTADADAKSAVAHAQEWMRRFDKPVLLSFEGAEPSTLARLREQTDFALFDDVDESLSGIAMLRQYSRYRSKPPANPMRLPVDEPRARQWLQAMRAGRSDIGTEAGQVMEAYGVRFVPQQLASSREQAAAIADRMGYPVVLKVAVRGSVHKSDVGGVILNLGSREAVANSFETIRDNIATRLGPSEFRGVIVQPMVSGGHEFILGGKRDAQFGPVVLFGLGGIFAEVFQDVTCRLAPLTHAEAEEMINEVKGSKILTGLRGQPKADVSALADALVRLGQLVAEQTEIKEVDVNPMIVLPAGQGALAVDARIILRA